MVLCDSQGFAVRSRRRIFPLKIFICATLSTKFILKLYTKSSPLANVRDYGFGRQERHAGHVVDTHRPLQAITDKNLQPTRQLENSLGKVEMVSYTSRGCWNLDWCTQT
ncbi:hypothetical protein P8452_52094 [Trifolium repens]|nr:hypothetical protein P8452_52094 [Trifolium repens]